MQQAQADHHAPVTCPDAPVGVLLAGLRTLGLEATTAVVFTADHGASLGGNGLLSKIVFAPQSHRVPLIVRAPGIVPAGRVDDALSEGLDVARTSCTLAGIAPDTAFEGRCVRTGAEPEAVFSVIGKGAEGSRASSAANVGPWPDGRGWPRRACVRTRRFRVDMNVRQDGGPVIAANEDALPADRLAHPQEPTNPAGDPAHAATVARFRAMLRARAAEAVQPAFVPACSAAETGALAPPALTTETQT